MREEDLSGVPTDWRFGNGRLNRSVRSQWCCQYAAIGVEANAALTAVMLKMKMNPAPDLG